MAALDDLLARIDDVSLRADIERELAPLRGDRELGLVFERHLPEKVRLPGLPVRRGTTVEVRAEQMSPTWQVVKVSEGAAELRRRGDDGATITETSPVEDLVVVREFGQPIYPGLRSVGRIERGGRQTVPHGHQRGELPRAGDAAVHLRGQGRLPSTSTRRTTPAPETGSTTTTMWTATTATGTPSGCRSWRSGSCWPSVCSTRTTPSSSSPSTRRSTCGSECCWNKSSRRRRIQMVSSRHQPGGRRRGLGALAGTDEYLYFVMLGDAGNPCALELGHGEGRTRHCVSAGDLLRQLWDWRMPDARISPSRSTPCSASRRPTARVSTRLGKRSMDADGGADPAARACGGVADSQGWNRGSLAGQPATSPGTYRRGTQDWELAARATTIYYLKRGEQQKVERRSLPGRRGRNGRLRHAWRRPQASGTCVPPGLNGDIASHDAGGQ